MSESLGTAVLELTTDNSSLRRGLSDGETSTRSTMGTLGHLATIGGAAIFTALGVVAVAGFKEMNQGAQVAAQTEAVLKSTGDAANVTAGQVQTLGLAIMKKSGIDDEAVKSGENMLLTFTNIHNEVGKGNDIFNQATTAVADMDTAMSHGNVTSENMSKTAILVGKALNDPIAGLSALHRVGVTFDDDQKSMIKSMMAAGDTMGAQKVIMAELNKEFGGSAEAMGTTLPGQINILQQSFNNAAGDLMTVVLPALTAIVGGLSDLLGWLSNGQSVTQHFQDVMDQLGISTQAQAKVIADLKTVWADLQAGVSTAVTVISYLWDTFGSAIKSNGQTIMAVLQFVIDLLHGDWSAAWNDAKTAVSRAIDTILGLLRGALTVFKTTAVALGGAVVDGLTAGLHALEGVALRGLTAVANAITSTASNAIGWAQKIGTSIVTGVVGGLGSLLGKVGDALAAVPVALFAAGLSAAADAVHIGLDIVDGIMSGLGGLLGKLKKYVEDQVRGALSSLWPFSSVAHGGELYIGQPIVEGALTGLQGLAEKTKTKISGDVREALTGNSALIGQAAQILGKDTVQGIVNGVVGVQQSVGDQLKTALQSAITQANQAAHQQVEAAKSQFASDFGQLAQTAVSAFNDHMQGWVSPAQKILDVMQLQDQEAQYRGAVTAALNAINADKDAITAAQNASDDVALQAANKQLLADQTTYEGASRSYTEYHLSLVAAKEGEAHTAQVAAQATNLTTLLTQLQTELPNHLAEWVKHHAGVAGDQGTFHVSQFLAEDSQFAKLLTQVQTQLGLHNPEWVKLHENILTTINSYVDKIKAAGQSIGEAFSKGVASGLGAGVGGGFNFNIATSAVGGGSGDGGPDMSAYFPSLDTGGTVLRTGMALVHEGETYSGVGGGKQPDGDVIMMLDHEVLGRITRRELIRTKARGAVLFGT